MPLAVERDRPGSSADIAQVIRRSIEAAEGRAEPFPHWRMAAVLPEAVAQAIAAMPLPAQSTQGRSGRRELHNDSRRYLAGDLLGASPAALAVARAFQAPTVARALAMRSGAALAGSSLRIEYALDTDGFWLEPHTDLGVKLLSLLLQLPGPGQEGLGTDLYFDGGRWAERAPFAWNAALMFAPSDRTWHGFEPRPIGGVRRSLIVNYVTPAWRSREQLAFPGQPVATE